MRLDRIQLVSQKAATGKVPKHIDGYVLKKDSFVRSQTTTTTYARRREFRGLTNGAQVYWQYHAQKAWLEPWKITIIGDDFRGLSRDEVEKVLKHCGQYRLLLAEVAIDFSPETGVNRKYIRAHAVFGKSRRYAKRKPKRTSVWNAKI